MSSAHMHTRPWRRKESKVAIAVAVSLNSVCVQVQDRHLESLKMEQNFKLDYDGSMLVDVCRVHEQQHKR